MWGEPCLLVANTAEIKRAQASFTRQLFKRHVLDRIRSEIIPCPLHRPMLRGDPLHLDEVYCVSRNQATERPEEASLLLQRGAKVLERDVCQANRRRCDWIAYNLCGEPRERSVEPR